MSGSAASRPRRAGIRAAKREPFLIRNQTPTRLEIRGRHTLKLAPLQQIRVDCRPDHYLGKAAVHAVTDRAVAWEREPVRDTRVWATAWLTLFGTSAIGIAVLGILSTPMNRGLVAATSAAALLCVGAAYLLNRGEQDADDDDPLTAGGRRLTGWRFTKDVAIAALQKLALVIVLILGILGPAAAIYYGTELASVLTVTGWLRGLEAPESSYPVIVARALQTMLVVILALIPGLMYFQFDREKLTTLIDRWLHNAFRLDPTLRTISDVDAKYGRRVEEFYGATFDSGVATPKKRTTTRSPLYVATVLLAVGWVVVLLNSPADLELRGGALVPEGGNTQQLPAIQRFIQPAFTPMTCAFLGAYFFAVQLVLLGYVRGDLRPKTYNVVTVRILAAVILAWVLQALFGSPTWVLALSFLAGVIPETVLRRIRDVAGHAVPPFKGRAGTVTARASGTPEDPEADGPQRTADTAGSNLDELADRSPLIALDGIGIYERTRLAEEGITSIQALARHDLVDLMLSSRVPASRLIDWIDQALLYQHVTAEDRSVLRSAGIRTATELLTAHRAPSKGHLCALLGEGNEGRLQLIVEAIRGDDWFTTVRNWRLYDETKEPGRTVYTETGYAPDLCTPPGGNGHLRRIPITSPPTTPKETSPNVTRSGPSPSPRGGTGAEAQ